MKALRPSDAWSGPIPLTHRQLELLHVLHELVVVQRLAPTYDDIALEMELAGRSSVCRLVHHLVAKGWVAVEPCPERLQVLHPPPVALDFDLEFTLSPDLVAPAALELLPIARPHLKEEENGRPSL